MSNNNTLSNFDYANIFTSHIDVDGQEFYNLYNNLTISGDIDASLYNEHYLTESDDWYSLAYQYYNDIRLWWVILIANNIINPFVIPSNPRIRILKSNVVSEIMSQIRAK